MDVKNNTQDQIVLNPQKNLPENLSQTDIKPKFSAKKKVIIIITTLLIFVYFFRLPSTLSYILLVSIQGNSVELDKLLKCHKGGAGMRYFNNGCVDGCGYDDQMSVCTQAFTWGCDCGASKCWDGDKCISNPDKKPYISPTPNLNIVYADDNKRKTLVETNSPEIAMLESKKVTVKNGDIDFSYSYPSNWTIDEIYQDDPDNTIKSPDYILNTTEYPVQENGTSIQIELYRNIPGKFIDQERKIPVPISPGMSIQDLYFGPFGAPLDPIKVVSVGGKEVVFFAYGGVDQYAFQFIFKNHIVSIQYHIPDLEFDPQKQTFEKYLHVVWFIINSFE